MSAESAIVEPESPVTVSLPVLSVNRKRGQSRLPAFGTGDVMAVPSKQLVSRKDVAKLSFTIKSVDGGIIEPALDENFYVEKSVQTILDVLHTLAISTPQNILLTGFQGLGKSELAIWFAAKYNKPLLMVNCATIRETKDWFGFKDVRDGSICWHKSDFVRAIEKGGCVILLDEFNRLHTTLHNSLYPLLDARRSTHLDEIDEMVKVGLGTVFFATANIGFTHTGTHTLDSAIEDRFGFRIDLTFPPVAEEVRILTSKVGVSVAVAQKLVRFATDIRRKCHGDATLSRVVSTRQLLQIAVLTKELMKRGLDIRLAFEYTILPFYSKEGGKDSEQAQVLQLFQGIFTGHSV